MVHKVLIVDDEPFMRQLIEQTLEDLEDNDVELLIADNGRAAIDLVRTQHPQLLLLDVMMPQMNGYEVCRTVRQEAQYDDIYIVMLTAKGQQTDRQKGEEVGANHYMTKPFDPDALLQLAMSVLDLK